MQRQYGNATVSRYLSGINQSNQQPGVQRKPQKKTAKEEKKSGQPKDPIHGKIYELVKEQLGEAKLKKHAESISKAAADALADQVKGADSEADFVKKAQAKLLGKQLKTDIKNAVTELLKSPEGKKLKGMILHAFKTEPNVAVGAVLVAMAAAIAANAPAKLDLDGKIGKSGFKWATKADLGKLRQFSLNSIQAGLSYSGKEYGAKFSIGYTGEKEKEGGGKEPAKATTSATLNFKQSKMMTDLGPIVTRPEIALTSRLILSSKPVGVAGIRIGDKKNFLSSEVKVDLSGNTTFKFSHMKTLGAAGLLSAFTTGSESTGSHKLTLNQPFDVKNLKLTANITYTTVDPTIKEAGINLQYKLVDKKGAPIPLLYLSFEGDFKASSSSKPQAFSGVAVIQGRF
jgi:hypothetical protein